MAVDLVQEVNVNNDPAPILENVLKGFSVSWLFRGMAPLLCCDTTGATEFKPECAVHSPYQQISTEI